MRVPCCIENREKKHKRDERKERKGLDVMRVNIVTEAVRDERGQKGEKKQKVKRWYALGPSEETYLYREAQSVGKDYRILGIHYHHSSVQLSTNILDQRNKDRLINDFFSAMWGRQDKRRENNKAITLAHLSKCPIHCRNRRRMLSNLILYLKIHLTLWVYTLDPRGLKIYDMTVSFIPYCVKVVCCTIVTQ